LQKSIPRPSVAVFCWRENKFLMQLDPETGCWSVPGGKIEHGEEPWAAGWREVEEETGLPVLMRVGVVAITTDVYRGQHWTTIWLDADAPGGDPRLSDEASEFRWCWWDDLPKPLFQPFWYNLAWKLPFHLQRRLRKNFVEAPDA
jgi:8-oxo-dGTP pyrophosphatase MutT (NUDIX family)